MCKDVEGTITNVVKEAEKGTKVGLDVYKDVMTALADDPKKSPAKIYRQRKKNAYARRYKQKQTEADVDVFRVYSERDARGRDQWVVRAPGAFKRALDQHLGLVPAQQALEPTATNSAKLTSHSQAVSAPLRVDGRSFTISVEAGLLTGAKRRTVRLEHVRTLACIEERLRQEFGLRERASAATASTKREFVMLFEDRRFSGEFVPLKRFEDLSDGSTVKIEERQRRPSSSVQLD